MLVVVATGLLKAIQEVQKQSVEEERSVGGEEGMIFTHKGELSFRLVYAGDVIT